MAAVALPFPLDLNQCKPHHLPLHKTRPRPPIKRNCVFCIKWSVADIAFFKQQQWSTTNYALSIHAALLVIAYQLLTDKTERLATWQGWLLVVLAWSVCVIGLAVVQRLQSSILGRRTRLERVRSK